MSKILIKWKKSTIGYPRNQRRVIRALGLRRLNQEVVHDDNPSILGMVHKVKHLVSVAQGKE